MPEDIDFSGKTDYSPSAKPINFSAKDQAKAEAASKAALKDAAPAEPEAKKD